MYLLIRFGLMKLKRSLDGGMFGGLIHERIGRRERD